MRVFLRHMHWVTLLLWLAIIGFTSCFGVVASVIAFISFQLLLLLEV